MEDKTAAVEQAAMGTKMKAGLAKAVSRFNFMIRPTQDDTTCVPMRKQSVNSRLTSSKFREDVWSGLIATARLAGDSVECARCQDGLARTQAYTQHLQQALGIVPGEE